jgi:hypothetical protein
VVGATPDNPLFAGRGEPPVERLFRFLARSNFFGEILELKREENLLNTENFWVHQDSGISDFYQFTV